MTQLALKGMDRLEIYHPNSILISRQEFGLLEKRILFLVMEQIKPLQGKLVDTSQSVEVEIYQARKKVGNPSWKNWTTTLDTILTRRYTRVSIGSDNSKKYEGKVYFPTVTYQENTGVLKVALNQSLNQAWMDMTQGYTKQMLNSCLSLTSSHAVGIYNLICRYNEGKILTVDEIKEYLDIKGKYHNWNMFKNRVLDVAKGDIDERTDYIFMWTIHRKRGRKIEQIKIWGEPKVGLLPDEDREVIEEKMDQLNIKDRTHRTYILNHSDEFVNALRKAHKAHQNTSEIKNVGGYILKVMGLVGQTDNLPVAS